MMHVTPTRPRLILILGFLTLMVDASLAALAPRSPDELEKDADHIVVGTVISVESKVQKSNVETGIGIHRDRVYRIKLKVASVSKGGDIKVGSVIEMVAWKPVRRIPPVVGLQGHEPIPEKGDSVTAYLRGKDEKAFKPILPNGMVTKSNAEKPAKAAEAKRRKKESSAD